MSELNELSEYEPVLLEHIQPTFYKVNDYLFPDFTATNLHNIKNLEVREDDVWVCSFPKSGTTWLQELVYMIMNNCDGEKAKSSILEDRFPYIDAKFDYVKNLQSPRFIKTHLPIEFLPEGIEQKCKVVYIMRNPKDVAVSMHYFMKMIQDFEYSGDMKHTIQIFIEGNVLYGPWWKHVNNYSTKENIFLIHYEELYKNAPSVLRSLCTFLNRNLTDEQIEFVINWCSFEHMKNNPSVNYEWMKQSGRFNKEGEFFRKGKIGDWMNHFTNEESNAYDEILGKKLNSKLKFDYGH